LRIKPWLVLFVSLVGFVSATTTLANTKSTATKQSQVYTDPVAQVVFIKKKVGDFFPGEVAEVLAIIYCETRSRPYIHWEADGSLRRRDDGKGSASGGLQVLVGESVHGMKIREMGLDMNNIDDYFTFTKLLMDQRGPVGSRHRYDDWNESRPCWGPRMASN